jgi:hypothetical protein
MPLLDLANLADVDTQLFTTWYSNWGTPAHVVNSRGDFVAVQNSGVFDDGPGAFVAPDIIERGYNPYFGAPGYYADAHGVDRVIPDQYLDDTYPAAIGVNPWDHIFGTFSGDPVHYMDRVHADEQPIQAGEYSLS